MEGQVSGVSGSPLQAAIKAKGELIFSLMESETKSIFSKDRFYGGIMEWSMKNEHFKTQMFRFVDVLPYLNSGSEVARHLKEYFAESGDNLPSVFNFGLGMGSLAPGLMASVVRKNVEQMAKMFITGETPQEALAVLKKARKNKVCFTVDILGEACLSETESIEYQKRYLELVTWLAKDSNSWDHVPQIDEDERGPIPRVNCSVKISSLYSQIDVKAWEQSRQIICDRLRPIFRAAIERGVFINLDMEQYELKDFTLDVFRTLLSEPEFKTYPHFGCVIQAYLRDSLDDVKKLCVYANERGTPFTIRLVKGAYWDFETVNSEQHRWPVPVYTNKRESDANYEDCALVLMQNHPQIRLALGSHNVRSIAACLVHAERLGLDPRAIEVQMLYGMADAIKKSLTKMGFRVREYAPVGELIPGMAYLVRRLLENTSNESFLRSKFAENNTTENLLRDPRENLQKTSGLPPTEDRFYNEPLVDFAFPEMRDKLRESFAHWTQKLGAEYPLHIAGKDLMTGKWIESSNPSHPQQMIGKVALASNNEAQAAMKAARAAYPSWRATPVSQRADMIDKLAEIFVRDRFELIALEVMEAGKAWEEADGDITEAIDFCRYYARQMREIATPRRVGKVAGEVSMYAYKPLGVSVVIAPWNFPLAILAGMVAGSLVTGNTVVFKPAEQTPVIGAYLMKALKEIGFPPGVVNFLNGYGEEIGEFLTSHIDTNLICFTGSKAVGLHIIKKTGEIQAGQQHVKRAIVEMGGKNAIIIDSDADLDEAVTGVVYSAFGFQGQKCSACSRVVVLQEIYDRFVARLVDTTKSICTSFAENPDTFVGPVIDEEAKQRILKMIEVGKSEAKLAYQGTTPSEGHFVGPTIFTDVSPTAKIALEEIFGPVLAVIKAQDIDEALAIANGTEYALTGGVYSRSPANIEKVKQLFDVGNLYINRGITGAMVDRHPFGGFKMSGLGNKTGGPDYLLGFMEPKVTTENTLRRGFAPQEEA